MSRKDDKIYWLWAVGLGLPGLLVLLFLGLRGNQALMGAWVAGVMAPAEQTLARLWGVFPCSVAELLTALVLAGLVLWTVRALALAALRREARPLIRRLLALGAALLWLWAGLCWMWNAAYYAPGFAQRAGLEAKASSVDELARVTQLFARRAAEYAAQVRRDGDGLFAEDRTDLLDRGLGVYDAVSREFPTLALDHQTRAKPILFSRLQSRMGFTGVYFPFTGEANVNTDAPLCLFPATIAHEMAHQRMVASEQEANFVGILASVTSGDPAYVYSGYLMGLIQLCNALYPAAPERWQAIARESFTPELSADWNQNNAYWAALSSPLEDRANQVYDSFLKGNDQALGIRSYGACVDLLTAYFGPEA